MYNKISSNKVSLIICYGNHPVCPGPFATYEAGGCVAQARIKWHFTENPKAFNDPVELYLGKKKTFRLEAAIIEISAKSKNLASAVVLVPQNDSFPYFFRVLKAKLDESLFSGARRSGTTMACAVIVRRHNGVQSYLVLDDNPREMLRHVGFIKEFSVRTWGGSVEADEAREEWAEMLGEDPFDGTYGIIDSGNWEFTSDAPLWVACVQDQG